MSQLAHRVQWHRRCTHPCVWLGVLTLACIGCGGGGPSGQPLALSPQQELALGRQAYHEVLNNPQKYGYPLGSDTLTVKTRRVAGRLIRAVGNPCFQEDTQPFGVRVDGYYFEWEVNVLENPQANAFCLPGGKIVVFTGLFDVIQDDDQLATVLGHEIGHALAHHTSERLAHDAHTRQVVAVLGGISGGLPPAARQAVLSVFGLSAGLAGKRYSRSQETDADHIGLYLMTFAGYDPREGVAFWENMARKMQSSRRPPAFLSDHPSDAARIQSMQKWVPEVERAKENCDQRRGGAARTGT